MQHEAVCRITCAGRSPRERGGRRRGGGERRGECSSEESQFPVASLLLQGTTVCSPHPPEVCVECGGRGEKGDSLVKGPAGTSTSVVPPHQEPCAGAWQHGPSVPGPGSFCEVGEDEEEGAGG